MKRDMIGVGGGALLAVALTACSASPPADTNATATDSGTVSTSREAAGPEGIEVESLPAEPMTAQSQPSSQAADGDYVPEYVIQEGDALGIKFFFNPELNEEVVVRPDGRISLQLVPAIVAAGRTPSELTQELKQMYSAELESPELSVIVRSFSAQRVFVGGEVDRPGELDLIDGLTVLGAIARAEGLTDRGKKEAVVIIHRGEDGVPEVAEFNLQRIRKGLAPDPLLAPYDVVFVPMTKIANLNKWMDQYIRGNIPVSFGFRLDIDELNN